MSIIDSDNLVLRFHLLLQNIFLSYPTCSSSRCQEVTRQHQRALLCLSPTIVERSQLFRLDRLLRSNPSDSHRWMSIFDWLPKSPGFVQNPSAGRSDLIYLASDWMNVGISPDGH